MLTGPLPILGALVAIVALSEWLARRTWLRHLGAALLVIVLTAVAANVGVVPVFGPETPVYRAIFEFVAPMGIFWLLLLVDLRTVLRAGGPILSLFLVGAAGTALGVAVGHWTVGGAAAFGPEHAALAGMFTGTYVGGAVNFNAVALEYGVVENPALYGGAAAVDNAMTTAWMIACVALPRVLTGFWPARSAVSGAEDLASVEAHDGETTGVLDLAVLFGLGFAVVPVSNQLALTLERTTTIAVPSTLVLTTLAIALAQLPVIQRLRGTRVLGLFTVYLFLAVIGTLCDLEALQRMGALAPVLAAFVSIVLAVHGVIVFGAARLVGIDPETASVVSQANVGGGTSALALARSLGRPDLELPAILVGAVGNALGNYLGFFIAAMLAT